MGTDCRYEVLLFTQRRPFNTNYYVESSLYQSCRLDLTMKAEIENLEDMPFLAREGDPLTRKLVPTPYSQIYRQFICNDDTCRSVSPEIGFVGRHFCVLSEREADTDNALRPRPHGVNFLRKVFTGCGKSPEGAEQRGCVYDILAGAFLPRSSWFNMQSTNTNKKARAGLDILTAIGRIYCLRPRRWADVNFTTQTRGTILFFVLGALMRE